MVGCLMAGFVILDTELDPFDEHLKLIGFVPQVNAQGLGLLGFGECPNGIVAASLARVFEVRGVRRDGGRALVKLTL